MTNEQLDALVERTARAWASIDGKAEAFDACKADPAREETEGRYGGYLTEAKELLRRSGVADAITTLLARAEAAEADAKTARFWEATAKRRIEMMQKYYLRDAKLAIGGDLRALRNRVAMMEEEPMQIVPSDAALAARDEERQP